MYIKTQISQTPYLRIQLLILIFIFFSQSELFTRDKDSEIFEELVYALSDPDPEVRKSAVICLSKVGSRKAIEPLLKILGDTDEGVRTKAWETLKRLAKVDIELDKSKWLEWWESEGKSKFGEEARELGKLETIKDQLSYVIIVGIIAFIMLIFFIITFAFIGGYKIKELKEKLRHAEVLIKDGEKIIGESVKVFDEIAKRRDDIVSFSSKLREESETELERFMELLESNTEHKIRESIAKLREEAEREIEHSFNQMKGDAKAEMKDLLAEQRHKTISELKNFEENFLKEIESHKLFIQANLYFLNNRPDDALKTYKKIISVKPDYYLAWNNQGDVYKHLKRYDEALESYQKALEFSQDNPLVLYNISSIYALLKRKDKMLEYLSKVTLRNGELKDEAINDICFQEYWNDADFKDLTES